MNSDSVLEWRRYGTRLAHVKPDRSNATLIPRQSRGLYVVSRSKRLGGVANAAPC